jgi:uncharacterized membrane protein
VTPLLLATLAFVGSHFLMSHPLRPTLVARLGERGFTILYAFILWALVHISLAGDPRNLVVAGGIVILGLFGSIGQDRKKARLLGEPWREWRARTSFVPFAAAFAGRVRWRDTIPGPIALVGGVVLWALVTSYHAPLVSPLGDLLSR